MSGTGILAGRSLESDITVLLALNTALMVEVLFYGIHIVLFAVCIFILIRNRRTTQLFILLSAVAMFALSTADAAITMHIATHDIAFTSDPEKFPLILRQMDYKNILFVANNFISELILLYRCYMVWGRSKYILIGASFLVLVDSVWGYLTVGTKLTLGSPEGLLPLYVWSIFGFNIVLGSITVGRILWIGKAVKRFIGSKQLRSYNLAIAVIIESSVIYSACVLTYVLFPIDSPYKLVVMTVCMRLVSIMPTLLLVQVGLGRTVTDEIYSTDTVGMSTVGASMFSAVEARTMSQRRSCQPERPWLASPLPIEDGQESSHGIPSVNVSMQPQNPA